MKQTYTSGLIARPPKGQTRSHVIRKAYVFEIRTGMEMLGMEPNPWVILEFHSSVTRRYGHGASTTVRLRHEDAQHLLAGLLSALHGEAS